MADNVRIKIEERLRAAFSEVMQKAGGLIDEALDEHFNDMKAIFLRDRALAVSLALGVDMNEAGQIEVAITCGYVKEKVKQKTTARVTPGQTEIPVGAYRVVHHETAKEREPIDDESRMLGAGAPQLAEGKQFEMGEGEAVDDGRSCATCRNNHGDVGGCHDNGVECGPELKFYAPEDEVVDVGQPEDIETPLQAIDDKFGHRRGPANVGSRNHSDSPFYCGDGMEYCDVENRLARVKEMNIEQLRQVIELPGCQKSVVKAAKVRLKKLEKQAGEERMSRETCESCDHWSADSGGCDRPDGMSCNNFSAWKQKMTCGNCGSREGEHGCGLDVGENDEPCNSWSLKAAVA